MPWRRFCLGLIGRDEYVHETETYMDEDRTSRDDETVVSEKSVRNICCYRELLTRPPLQECLKVSFLVFNGIILFIGIPAIVISAWLLNDRDFISRLNSQHIFIMFLLISAVFVSIVAFIGILGITTTQRHFIIFYIICQTMVLCVLFVCLTMNYTFFKQIAKKIQNDMISSLTQYDSLKWAKETWDNTQRLYKCCGIKSSMDWWNNQLDIPLSCCTLSIFECMFMVERISYKKGCLKEAVVQLRFYIDVVSISMLIVVPFLLSSVFLALALLRRQVIRRVCRSSCEA